MYNTHTYALWVGWINEISTYRLYFAVVPGIWLRPKDWSTSKCTPKLPGQSQDALI